MLRSREKVECMCRKCGKTFMGLLGQQYCGNPCISATRDKVENKRPILPTMKTDCKMFRDHGDGTCCCTGLIRVYCAFEDCGFYKPKN